MKIRNKAEDLNIIKQAAKLYEKNLNNKSLMFIYLDREYNEILYYEVMFKETYFKHLTGVSTNLSNRIFYKKSINNTLTIDEFDYKDSNTKLKLDNIIKGMEINKYARMIGDFQNNRKYLSLSKVAGSQNLAMGFDSSNNYNYPKTFLVGDIRKLTIKSPFRILCILSKEIRNSVYDEITYIAKDIIINKLNLKVEIKQKISKNLI